MIIVVIFLIWTIALPTVGLILNDKCLIPGTTNYRCRQLERKNLLDQELARSAAVMARYRAKENEMLDTIRDAPRQLEAAK